MSTIFRQIFGLGVMSGIAYWFWRYFAPQHSTLVLEDKVVVVTGVSSELGKALALSFAQRGTSVVLVGKNAESLESVQREVEPYASAVLSIAADIFDPEQRNTILSETLATFGQIDVLVNQPEFVDGNLETEVEAEHIRNLIEANLTSTILLTQEILPTLRAQGEGYILFIGSGFQMVVPAFSAYIASKYGIAGFADSLRQELAGTNVHVTLATASWGKSKIFGKHETVSRSVSQYATTAVDKIADELVEGLVQGQHEVVLGGFWGQLGILLERFSLRLSHWY